MSSASLATNRKSGYLPSLDGWRAIAILGVLLAHDMPWAPNGGPKPFWQNAGGSGVNLFFAISGLLITTRILEEESLNGFFNIRGFYIRRFFRIQPAAFAYLGFIAILMLLHVLHDQWHFWLGGVFLYENFVWKSFDDIPHSYFVGHFWTLAVEEHFYLLLSLTLFFLKRFRLAFLLGAWLLLHFLEKYATLHQWEVHPRRTLWQIGHLVLAATLAVALRRPAIREFCARWLRPWVMAIVIVAATILKGRHDLFHAEALVQTGLAMLEHFYPFIIAATMLHPLASSTRLLEWKPLRWLGKISYSLYLWHLLFFFRDVPATHVTQPILLALSGRPAKYIAALAMAGLSYYVLELPCMRLGHRLAPPKLAGRPELAETTPAA